MNTILYATDYSENSIAALKYAHKMSSKINAKLLAVHIFDYPSVLRTTVKGSSSELEQDALKEQTEKLEGFCKKHLEGDFDKMNFSVEAIQDKSAVNGIVSKAEAIQPLLIISGMKGTSKLRRLIMGSTARGLIDEAPCPVLTIPEDTSYNEISTIVYATDFQEEDLGAINKLALIAKPLNANIKIVHISPLKDKIDESEQKTIKEKINKNVKYKNVELVILYSDDIFDSLKIYFGKTNADILAMLERPSSSFTSEMFSQTLVKKIKSYGRIPLLSFNAKNKGIFHL